MAQRIGIVGAGPAGLIAGIAACRLGFDVDVFERANRFERLGGGVGIQANGMQVLDSLGLLDSFRPNLSIARYASVFSSSGRVISRADFRDVAIPHSAFAVVERYLLQEHLVAALRAEGLQIQFGKHCTGMERTRDGAQLSFADAANTQHDVILACDGTRSAVRDSSGIHSRKQPNRAIGEAYLRVVAQCEIDPNAAGEYWGADGTRVGIFRLAGGRTYLFCSVPLGEWKAILTTRLDEWLRRWQPFGETIVTVMRSVDWASAVYDELQEVHLRQWFKTPVFIVGDAAHAMTPNLGQGANSAMVDSLVLIRLLDDARRNGDTLEEVGRKYEHVRKAFVTRIQNAARQGGNAASWKSPIARSIRDTALSLLTRVGALRRASLRFTAGYNPRDLPFITTQLLHGQSGNTKSIGPSKR
jgi:2-polyprenyl-6-methoxyphenol hydroxylase-like FAD-dependent oxidoreductase